MNVAGGGTNKPKIVSGTTYAQGGGLIGSDKKSDPSYRKNESALGRQKKEENSLIQSLQSYAKSVARSGDKNLIKALNDVSSSLRDKGSSGISGGGVPTGSLLTNPLGAIQRISGIKTGGMNLPGLSSKLPSVPSGMKLPGLPGGMKLPGLSGGMKLPGLSSGKSKSNGEGKGFFQELREKLSGSGAATYRDAGSIYAKQMLGGFGGPVSERDLSKESQAELQKAIGRAKKRTGSEIAKAEAKIKELRAQGAKDGNPALETQKSFLKKLKEGGIRVQYTDYADEKGKISESAKNAKNILGQFWAKERTKKEGGGYRIEDKYDFDMMKKKDEKTGKMRDMNTGELIMEGILGKGKSVQQRLQAAYLLNPLRGKGDVDMVLGGKRTAAESWGLSGSKTLLGGLLGASGKPKDKNTQALEAKRPWWDKAGWFGGGSRVSQEQAKKAQIARSKPKSKPVSPPSKPKPKVTVVKAPTKPKYQGGQRSGKTRTPNFSASNPVASNTKAKTIGVNK